MGNIFSYGERPTKKLYSDVIDDVTDFVIEINIYTIVKLESKHQMAILEYLQFMHPTMSYICNNTIFLIFNQKQKSPFLRSNESGELIAYISSELSIWLLKNLGIDIRMVNIEISIGSYTTILHTLLKTISDNKYSGIVYGWDVLNEEKVREQFGSV
jgi:hypothetical protein